MKRFYGNDLRTGRRLADNALNEIYLGLLREICLALLREIMDYQIMMGKKIFQISVDNLSSLESL